MLWSPREVPLPRSARRRAIVSGIRWATYRTTAPTIRKKRPLGPGRATCPFIDFRSNVFHFLSDFPFIYCFYYRLIVVYGLRTANIVGAYRTPNFPDINVFRPKREHYITNQRPPKQREMSDEVSVWHNTFFNMNPMWGGCESQTNNFPKRPACLESSLNSPSQH